MAAKRKNKSKRPKCRKTRKTKRSSRGSYVGYPSIYAKDSEMYFADGKDGHSTYEDLDLDNKTPWNSKKAKRVSCRGLVCTKRSGKKCVQYKKCDYNSLNKLGIPFLTPAESKKLHNAAKEIARLAKLKENRINGLSNKSNAQLSVNKSVDKDEIERLLAGEGLAFK